MASKELTEIKIEQISYRLILNSHNKELVIEDPQNQEALIHAKSLNLFLPDISEIIESNVQDIEVLHCANDKEIIIQIDGYKDVVDNLQVHLLCKKDYIEIFTTYHAKSPHKVRQWNIFAPGTRINMYCLINFRNRHYRPETYLELSLGGELTGGELGNGGQYKGFSTSTDSTDWQFAPHPDLFIFQKHNANLFFGTKQLPHSFGMKLTQENYIVKEWFLDYGRDNGYQVNRGEEMESPRYILFLDHNKNLYETLDYYTNILIKEGYIPDGKNKKIYDWWKNPVYCTWGDQSYISEGGMQWGWYGEEIKAGVPASGVLNEKFIFKVLEVIERERLPFSSIIIDDRWFTKKGDWESDTKRFHDFRRLIDIIHESGLKVFLWWSIMDVDRDAEILKHPEWLTGEGKVLNKFGLPMIDFSKPEVQKEYLKPLLRRFISDEPSCYDADGLKYDFLADKVHSSMPIYDKNWCGEEMFLWRLLKLVYEESKRIKEDACILGCTAHPYFGQYQDMVRTYDVHTSDYLCHKTRGLMICHTTPGTLISYDLHSCREKFAGYLDMAVSDNITPQIGSIIGFSEDNKPCGKIEYNLLRKIKKGV